MWRARALLDRLFAGIDSSVTKKQAKSQITAQKARAVTFKAVAEQYIAQHEAGWKNAKRAAKRRAIVPLGALPSLKTGGLLFPGSKPTTKLSDMALTAVIRRMEINAVPHGL